MHTPTDTTRTRVSLIAIPDAVISTLSGIYDVLGAFNGVASIDSAVPHQSPFQVEIVGERREPVPLASGVPIQCQAGIDDIDATDIVIVPSLVVEGDRWQTGRYPRLIDWFTRMHAQGALFCSACSGIFLLAETALFDGLDATVHWGYAEKFRRTFPHIPVSPEKALVTAGERQQFISSGASSSWHDLVLYLVSRRVNPATAQAVARYYALQWHHEGLAPYRVFVPPRDHDDGAILNVQSWLDTHYLVANPVEEMVARSGLAARTLKRRFKNATGYSPIAYVQLLRIEDAKRRLERTDESIDAISWKAGYEDPAFFRRLFKRVVGMTPGAYRRKFRLPDFAARREDATPLEQ